MRLISYDFETDIPYENVIVSLKPSVELYRTIYKVIAYPPSLEDDGCWVLGKYLTKSKAKMTMKLMRNACLSGETIFQFPFDDDVEQKYKQKFAQRGNNSC